MAQWKSICKEKAGSSIHCASYQLLEKLLHTHQTLKVRKHVLCVNLLTDSVLTLECFQYNYTVKVCTHCDLSEMVVDSYIHCCLT